MINVKSGRALYKSPSPWISFKTTFNEKFDKDKFFASVESLKEKYPIITMKLEEDKNELFFNDKVRIEIPVFISNKKEPWENVLVSFIEGEHNISGPFVYFFILESEASFEMILSCHHVLADGLSTLMIFKDISESYLGKKMLGFQKPGMIEDYFVIPDEKKIPVEKAAFLNTLNNEWLETGKVFTNENYNELLKKFKSINPLELTYKLFTREESEKIKDYCHSNGITLNDFFITVSLASVSKDCQEVITMPLDIRRRILQNVESADLFGNGVSGIYVKVFYDSNKSFEENAKKIHSIIKQNIEDADFYNLFQFLGGVSHNIISASTFSRFGLFDHPFVEKVRMLMGTDSEKLLYLTNIGNIEIDVDDISEKMQDFVFVPSVAPGQKNTVGVATINGQICITCPKNKNNKESILEKITSEIEKVQNGK